MAPAPDIPATGQEARLASRHSIWDSPTCGIAAGYLQANLICLPSAYAKEFELLCARNPVPCPLLARSATVGDFENFKSFIPGVPDDKIAAIFDVRRDAPRYNVYIDGVLSLEGIPNIEKQWARSDHVAFLIGCSYSFETALGKAGLTPPHVARGRNVPMYRTTLPLCPAGRFRDSTYVVSMRMYSSADVEKVRDVTRPFVATHGEPIAWGWNGVKALGIKDIEAPEWGDKPVMLDGKLVERPSIHNAFGREESDCVPVFWGCGVTPQEAVMRAKIPGLVMGHAPGHMIVLDVKEEDVV